MTSAHPPYEQFVRYASPAVAVAGVRWTAVLVVGFDTVGPRSVDEAGDMVVDLVADMGGTAAHWLVVDTTTGDSRADRNPYPWRAAALTKLRRHYDPSPERGHDAPDWAGGRTIVVSQDVTSKQFRLVEVDDALAMRVAGEDVLEGWIPLAIFDLDTGTMTELHIATPIVTPSEAQGVSVNPLQT